MDMSVQIFALHLVLLIVRKEIEFHSSKIDDENELHEYKINSCRKQKNLMILSLYAREELI